MLAQLSDPKSVLGIAVGIPLAVLLLALVWLRPGKVAVQGALTAVLVAGLAVAVAAVARTARWGGQQGITATLPPGVGVGTLPPQAATCEPTGPELRLAAQGIRFDTGCLAAPAGAAFTVTLDNRDSGVPHNLAIYTDQSASEVLFQGEIVTGPSTTTYRVGPLAPGTYFFRCDVHPTLMFGTFVVAQG